MYILKYSDELYTIYLSSFNNPPGPNKRNFREAEKNLGENTQEIENLITSQNKGIFKSGEGGGYLET